MIYGGADSPTGQTALSRGGEPTPVADPGFIATLSEGSSPDAAIAVLDAIRQTDAFQKLPAAYRGGVIRIAAAVEAYALPSGAFYISGIPLCMTTIAEEIRRTPAATVDKALFSMVALEFKENYSQEISSAIQQARRIMRGEA